MKKILFVAFALALACVSVITAKADPLNPVDGAYYAWTKVRCDTIDNGTVQRPGQFCHQLIVETRTRCFFTATVIRDANNNWQQQSKDPWSIDGTSGQYCMPDPIACVPGQPCPMLAPKRR